MDPAHHCSVESSEVQHRLERESLERMKERTDKLKEERASMLYGTREQKRRVQKENAEFMNDHFKHREVLKKTENDDDQRVTEAVKCHITMRNMVEQSNDEARRKFLHDHMRDNMRLAEYRKQLKKREEAEEREKIRREGNFMEKFGRNPM